MHKVSIIAVAGDDTHYEIELKIGNTVLRSGKFRGGLEPAVRNAECLMDAIINCGFSNAFDTSLGLRKEDIKQVAK